jgi:hypothetical protein
MTTLDIQKKLNVLGYGPIPLYTPAGKYGPITKQEISRFQQDHGLHVDGIAGPQTMAALFPPAENKGSYVIISQKALDLTLFSEIGSREDYDAIYRRPQVPGAQSGITVGFGYDLGYNTPKQIVEDWNDLVSDDMLAAMISASGFKGNAAMKHLPNIKKKISISWENAEHVFLERTLPRYAGDAAARYPGLKQLYSDTAGVIVDLVFNRGDSISGSTRTEMADLIPAIKKQDYIRIEALILSMKRLWDGKTDDGTVEKRVGGLLTRCDNRAKLVHNSKRKYLEDELVFVYYK